MYHCAEEITTSHSMSIFNRFQNHCGSNEGTVFPEHQNTTDFTICQDSSRHINNEYNGVASYKIIKQNHGQSTCLFDCESKMGERNWFEGCEVLGFIPDDCQSNNTSTQEYTALPKIYNHSVIHQNDGYQRMYYECTLNKVKPTINRNMKRKRKRTIFTTEQIIALEGMFQKKPYINREERAAMMRTLQVSEKAIKVWFQNRRRLTDKKNQEYISDSPNSLDVPDTLSDRLTFIESQINDNTDAYGYVTLSDDVINELARIIDDYLPGNVDTSAREVVPNPEIIENSVLYEPISPASTIESEDMEEIITEYHDYWPGNTNLV